jgi:hypothetical protein
VIYDFIVLPSHSYSENACRKLVEKELKRVMDFVRPSLNRNICENDAQVIAAQFGIELSEV